MSVGVERVPDCHCFGRKAAVGEADDERRVRPQDPQNLGEDLQGTLQVLDADTAQGGIAAIGLKRQDGVAVQVLHESPA